MDHSGRRQRLPQELLGGRSREELPWIEETLPVRSGSNSVIWDELYKAIRQGSTFPVRIEEAVQVMKVISAAKEGTAS